MQDLGHNACAFRTLTHLQEKPWIASWVQLALLHLQTQVDRG